MTSITKYDYRAFNISHSKESKIYKIEERNLR